MTSRDIIVTTPGPGTPPDLEMRLTAPLVVRGGKNSRENQQSPDSILRLILSRSRSLRSASRTGVEQRELSLEPSLPLVLPLELPPVLATLESLLVCCQHPSTRCRWFTMLSEVSCTCPTTGRLHSQIQYTPYNHSNYNYNNVLQLHVIITITKNVLQLHVIITIITMCCNYMQ